MLTFPTNPTTWQDWGGIATVIGIVIALIAALAAYRQLTELVRTRKLEALTGVFDLLSSERARIDRRYLFHHLKSPPDCISPIDRDHIERVCVDFERVGSLVKHGLVPEAELLEHHAAVIARTWRILEPYVAHRTKVLGGDYAQSFVWLGKQAEHHLSRIGKSNSINIIAYVPDPPPRRKFPR